MANLSDRVETAVSKIEDSSDIAEQFADVSNTTEFTTPNGQVKPIGLLQQEAEAAIQSMAAFNEETFVASTVYDGTQKVYFVDSGVVYTPVSYPYTAGTSVSADVTAGALIVLQGLMEGDTGTLDNQVPKNSDLHDVLWRINVTAAGSNNPRSLADRFADNINVKDVNSLQEALELAKVGEKPFVFFGKRSYITDTAWNPIEDPIYARTTPETALQSIGAHYNELGAAGRNYRWGHNSWFTNGGTAPLTNYSAVSQGYRVRSIDATSRQIGADGDAHSLEIISGQWAAKAYCNTTSGSNVIDVSYVSFEGSRFCIGDVVKGDAIPVGSVVTQIEQNGKTITGKEIEDVSVVDGGAGYQIGDLLVLSGGTYNRQAELVVLSVNGSGSVEKALVTDGGDYVLEPSSGTGSTGGSGTGCTFNLDAIIAGYGQPDFITINNNATFTGSETLEFRCSENLNIGLLISGSGDGCPDGSGNQNGAAIQIQAYGDAAFKNGLRFSGGGIRGDGRAMYASFVDISAFIEIDSSTFGSFIDLNGSDCTDSLLKVQNMEANYGLRFHDSNDFTFAAIYLDGQDIGTSSDKGMRIATSSNSKMGFWGKTPSARPDKVIRASGGATVDSECRLALDDLLDKLEGMGLLET